MEKIGMTEVKVVISYYCDHAADEEFIDIEVFTNDIYNLTPTGIIGIVEHAKLSSYGSKIKIRDISFFGDEKKC